MTKRLLIVAHGHPELATGGAEAAAYSLFATLKNNPDITPFFLAWSGAGAFQRLGTPFSTFRGRPDETIYFSDNFDNFLFSQQTDVIVELADYLKKIRPDVIHLHHYTRIGVEFIALARSLFPNVRIVVTLHEYLAICNQNGQMFKANQRSLCYQSSPHDCSICFPHVAPGTFLLRELFIKSHFDKVDLFLAPSNFLRDRYIAWGLPEEKIIQMDNGTKAVPPLPPRPRAATEGRGVFAYFGQINPFKGLLELLRAFEMIAQAPAPATAGLRLIVHGANLEFNQPEYVESVTKALMRNAARVHFAGPYRPSEVARLMAGVDWVVVPSIWWENSPLVIEEALAHRRPVLCSNIGGMAEKVLPGRDGFHFEVGNPFELAGMILQLAGNPDQWDRLYRSMRRPTSNEESARQHLEAYGWAEEAVA